MTIVNDKTLLETYNLPTNNQVQQAQLVEAIVIKNLQDQNPVLFNVLLQKVNVVTKVSYCTLRNVTQSLATKGKVTLGKNKRDVVISLVDVKTSECPTNTLITMPISDFIEDALFELHTNAQNFIREALTIDSNEVVIFNNRLALEEIEERDAKKVVEYKEDQSYLPIG